MRILHTIMILLMAFIAVFAEAALPGLRNLFGTQIDILPALMVYTALTASLNVVILLAVVGGLLFDSLSANPLGASVLPLFVVGIAIYWRRELILRDQLFAQYTLGAASSAFAPILTVLLLLTHGHSPLIGWGSLWQLIVMSIAGGVMTPLLFFLFNKLNHALGYRPVTTAPFRPDREIRRSRSVS